MYPNPRYLFFLECRTQLKMVLQMQHDVMYLSG